MHKPSFLLLVGLIGPLVILGCKPKSPSPASSNPQVSAPAPTEPNSIAAEPTIDPLAEPGAAKPEINTAADNMPSSSTTTNSDPKTEPVNETVPTKAIESTALKDSRTPPTQMVTPAPPETWTTQRLVVMGKGGPRFFKLDVNVGGQNLEHGFQVALAQLADDLHLKFDESCDWNTLLDKPLVSTGWLGNLVPASDQREQLRALYDTNNNDKVDEPEFRAFITRGLSRTGHLRVSSRPSNSPQVPSTSIWGPIDLDNDGELSVSEVSAIRKSMLRFDFDGDRIITSGELRSVADTTMSPTGSMRSGLLDMTPVHSWDTLKPDGMVRAVFDAYSFSDTLSKDLLYDWPESKLKRLDTDHDAAINNRELRSFDDQALDGSFAFGFSNQLHADVVEAKVNFQSLEPTSEAGWSSHPAGGRLTLDGCIVTIVINDEQDAAVREGFARQFERLAKDAQLQAFAMQGLELKEGAVDVLTEEAKRTERAAQDIAWRWLVAPRHWHMQIIWSASDSPWFELMDLNGDQKLVLSELEQFGAQLARWDRNKDGSIQQEEMPVSVLLEVRRGEARGLKSRLGGTAVEKRGTNDVSAPTWFTGMDYNSDGELTKGEFLGEQSDFEKLDRDRDGIIEAREVTTPQ